MSFGSSVSSQLLEDECSYAYNAGIVLVAAAGNSGPGTDTIGYPAHYSTVIAVGATDSNDVIAYFSSTGSSLSVVAPGVSIYSTYKGNTYATLSGTSMACPHVAGTVALILSKNNALSPSDVKTLLETTAVGIGTVPNSVYGYGRINTLAACQAIPAS
jgi:subtilisin